jgi:hypothetical protein
MNFADEAAPARAGRGMRLKGLAEAIWPEKRAQRGISPQLQGARFIIHPDFTAIT